MVADRRRGDIAGGDRRRVRALRQSVHGRIPANHRAAVDRAAHDDGAADHRSTDDDATHHRGRSIRPGRGGCRATSPRSPARSCTTELTVRGALPPELNGLYVRNGSNPASGDSPHWFFGDGMVHGVRLEDGKATMYRNRFVDTTMYQAGAGFGQGAPGGASNQSNVSAIWHGGRAAHERRGRPAVRLDPTDLAHHRALRLRRACSRAAFTAHPKIDPATGRLHSFGYGFVPPYLTYHVTEPDGTLSHVETSRVSRTA